MNGCRVKRTLIALAVSLLSFACFCPAVWAGEPAAPITAVQQPRCEYRDSPLGLDVEHPRLTWFVASSRRGERQSRFQVLVARSEEVLRHDQGDLWNSGKVGSGNMGAEYGGKPLTSGEPCFWKVRVWDKGGRASAWSKPASWSMGLLRPADWKAAWITSPTLADPANRPRTPINCYRSQLSANPNATKWVALDLGTSRSVSGIAIDPARPPGLDHDIRTVQFPRRFRLEVADNSDFREARVVVDRTAVDFPEPRDNSCRFDFAPVNARYVRLVVTRLGTWDAHDFGIFLGHFDVYAGRENVAAGAPVSASDSIEGDVWSKRFLTGTGEPVKFAPFPQALAPGVEGSFSPSRTPLLRRDFTLDAPVRRATLYSTARGFYEARINGQKVGGDLLSPGFTDYDKRISYQTHDVTALLHPGANAIGALLGYGWYAGHMNLGGNGYIYGYFPQLAAQLEIELVDGRHVTIATDGKWRTSLDGAVRWSDLLDGEACDFRREQVGWDKPGFADATWQPAWAQPLDPSVLVWQRTPPVKAIQTIVPVSHKQVRPGVWVYDLGQEITGWDRLKLGGAAAGTTVVLRHAEAIKPDGEIDTASLWGTPQQDTYVLDGKPHVLEPHFTYHGFRYVELSGLPPGANPDALVAINLHTEAAEVGQFACSNDLFNRLMNASRWTEKNLLFDVPAGCAARSERLAWTGDIRPCVQTALFDFDVTAFFEKYAADLRDDQKPDGRFTDIAPHAHLRETDVCVGSPGWADAGVSLPWEVYVNTGDRRLLAAHYDAARRWVDFIHQNNPALLWRNARGMNWSDWLSAGRATPSDIGSTAFFAHSTDLVAQMAAALGKTDDARRYRQLFQAIRGAFVARYVRAADGVLLETANSGGEVADFLRPQIKANRLKLKVNNASMGGDPALNMLKHLLLTYRIGTRQETVDYPEDAVVDLDGAGSPLEIVRAHYGPAEAPDSKGTGDRGDAQGSYALALDFGLLDEPLRSKATQRLIEVIHRDGGHPSTGFWSSVELVKALSDNGYNADASRLVALRTAPSWGYMVESGGTTLWESYTADKKTLSLNHWTHSACGEWFWRDVAGLNPDPMHPGYEQFAVRPRPTKEVTWCKAKYDSVRGPITIDWRAEASGQFTLALHVPSGSQATVYLPAASPTGMTEGGRPIAAAVGVKFLKSDHGAMVYEVQSGTYSFRTPVRR